MNRKGRPMARPKINLDEAQKKMDSANEKAGELDLLYPHRPMTQEQALAVVSDLLGCEGAWKVFYHLLGHFRCPLKDDIEVYAHNVLTAHQESNTPWRPTEERLWALADLLIDTGTYLQNYLMEQAKLRL